MARKKKDSKNEIREIIHAPIAIQPITETLEKNYMPYAMSVIISRAIPEIDGFKPAHRKLLYTMYKMGLMTGGRTKSTNVVGQTMKLNPHGDAAIYETMVRLTRANEALLHPFIDSKGTFGKQYSSDMKYAASRYTEVKLDSFCNEIFRGIDKNAVDMVDNYDGTMKEPVLLPTSYPNLLVTPNMGIAVGIESSVCPFNLAEICDGTIALLKNPKTSLDKIMSIVKAPDFPGGGLIIHDQDQLRSIYETGQGSIRIRSRYVYDKESNCIDIIQIPYSTSIELIIKRITELVKLGKLKEIVDFRDEIDLNGFKLTIDIRRGTDPDKLMEKLYKLTPLEDSFKCNFNFLVDSTPRQMGIIEILTEWIKFRTKCVSRELEFDLQKKKDKLHLLLGLGKILLDIDKAIRIIRTTEHEQDVVPNLEKGFEIDTVQAEYIADIKLRHLNREYILGRIKEIEGLQNEIAEIESILADELKLKGLIANQLTEVKKKYGQPRKSQIMLADDIVEFNEADEVENYNVKLILTKEGYFKKITMQSLRGNDEQALKDGDEIIFNADTDNQNELLFFTNMAQVYKAKVADFDNVKASVLGEFVPAKLGMDNGERPILVKLLKDAKDTDKFVFIFKNGKGVRIPLSAYQTKGNRRKLVNAYSNASPIKAAFNEIEPFELMILTENYKAIIIKSSLIPEKTTRTSGGVQLITLKKGDTVKMSCENFESRFENTKGYRKIKIPAVGTLIAEKDINAQQLKIE